MTYVKWRRQDSNYSKKSREKQHIRPRVVQNPVHLPAPNVQFAHDLQEVVDAWPKLPEAIRAGILAMIRTAE